jgi:uncharacterized membrane protein
MAISATTILIICLVVPNVAPALNFDRFYRATLVFLSPLYVVGGIYVFDLFKRIRIPSRIKFSKLTFNGFEMLMLSIILTSFFLFRVGFVNYVSGGYPISYSLNYRSADLQEKIAILSISIPECDISSARWLVAKIENNPLVYADEVGTATLFDYTSLSKDNTYPLLNTTQPETGSYVYLRGFNLIGSVVSFDLTASYPQYNISDISAIFIQSDKIYSNGQSEAYYMP